jgi:cytochrome c peroxidase
MTKSVAVISVYFICCSSFCRVDEELFYVPDKFPAPVYDFSGNLLSAEKVLLGRALFYDPILSRDNSISCSSCHSVYNSFAHTDHDLSHGIDDRIGTRNAPALINLAWQSNFMWDGAVNHLDVQALAPISHPDEMGENSVSVIDKLQNSDIYRMLFFDSYNDSLITGERMLKALAQFQLTLISANSKYDSVMNAKAEFTSQEENGYRLFQKNCSTCHSEPLFSTYLFANNGLPVDTTLNDFGRMNITHKIEDSLKFKIPSLRNIEYSLPYMHDGRFSKISEVINHYTDGVVQSNTLDRELRDPIILSANEKVDLLAFLLTLSDRNFIFNDDHAYPREVFMKK